MTGANPPLPSPERPAGLREPDYDQWGAKDTWTIAEAACLLLDWEPVPKTEIPVEEARARLSGIEAMMERDSGNELTWFQHDRERGALLFPWVVIEWAEKKGIDYSYQLALSVANAYPSRLRSGILLEERKRLQRRIKELEAELEQSRKEATPPYLNAQHQYYAVNLAAAVSVWTALFGQGQVRGSDGFEGQITLWLERHHGSGSRTDDRLSKTAIGHIKKVVMPNQRKEGGKLPRTRSRKKP
jgi:hypothetical protein